MSAFAAFGLRSTLAQAAAPFSIGHVFKKGDVPAGSAVICDADNFAITPLRKWNDGSLKHAAITGRQVLQANIEKQINLFVSTTQPATGTALTAASIQAANPQATVSCGAFGSRTLTSLLASPQRTFISNKEMVECHYQGQIGTDASLYVMFHVRLYVDGRMRVRAIVTNGYLDGTERVEKSYIPSILINSIEQFNNGNVAFAHSFAQRYDVVAWIGVDPLIVPRHDTGYINRTKLIPNYWKTGTSQGVIDAWAAPTRNMNDNSSAYFLGDLGSYAPGKNMAYTPAMGAAGFQDQIGILPSWEATYFAAQGNPTMYKVMVEFARAIQSYGIHMNSLATGLPIQINAYLHWSAYGDYQGGGGMAGTKNNKGVSIAWEGAHFPSVGYVAYMLTADYLFMEECGANAIACYLSNDLNHGLGDDRTPEGQIRGKGWAYRSTAQAAAIYPDALVAIWGQMSTWLGKIMSKRVAYYVTPAYPGAWIGHEDSYTNRNFDTGKAPNGQIATGVAAWECNFLTMAVGHALDIEPCVAADMPNLSTFATYVEGAPLAIMGSAAATDYNFGYASSYTLQVRSNVIKTGYTSPLAKDYTAVNGAMLFADTFATNAQGAIVDAGDASAVTFNPANPTTNTLNGSSGGGPGFASGYWGNLLPALAAAVDHAKIGATAAFGRFTGATNFSLQDVTSTYQDYPAFGIMPRSYVQPALVFTPQGVTPPVTGAPPPTSSGLGHTVRVDVTLVVASLVVGDTGLGVLGSAVPGSGTNGASIFYNDLVLPADANKQYRCTIVQAPTAGTLVLDEDGSFTFAGPDGSYSFVYKLFEDGVDIGNGTVNIVVGTASPTVTSVTISPTSATGSQQFVATAVGTNNPPQTFDWATDSGSVSTNGLFSAPPQAATAQSVTVKATSKLDPTKFAQALVTIPAIVPPSVRKFSLPLTTDGVNPYPNTSGLKYSWFDQATPDAFTAPLLKGNNGSIVGGVFNLQLPGSILPAGGVGYLILTNSTGDPLQNPPALDFSGSVQVS